MIGTIIYMALDISFNTTLWAMKKTGEGLYYGISYLLGYETEEDSDSSNNILMIKLDNQSKCIENLTTELKNMKNDLHINKS